MRSRPFTSPRARILGVALALTGGAVAADNLYVPDREVGNRQFFTPTQTCVEAPLPPNTPPPGFKALFNGRDLKNWQGLLEIKKRAAMSPEQRKAEQAKADALARAHWSVKDGVLVFDGKGQSLQTVKDYGNFELYVDWKIELKGDSGIYVRGNPQIQIWDNPIGSGGLFNNQKNPSKPVVVADRPVGEWNTFWVKMVGDRVWVKLNDKLVVDNTPLENYWDRGQPLPTTGPIELQNHGNTLYFRNIYIRELK